MAHNDLAEGARVLEIEARSIDYLRSKLDQSFVKALDLLQACTGKVVVTGMGKSGHVGRKIASTMTSTGTPAVFLHPAESSHGDMGMIASNDVVIAISYGGETPELLDVLKFVARKGIPLVAMTGKMQSTLGRAGTVTLDVGVDKEACPMGLAPTASSTVTLALGDALAMTLIKRRGFKEEDFAEYHPGGSLGRRLTTHVADVMHTGEALPVVGLSTGMKDVLSVMTKKEVRGVAGVTDEKGSLVGVITDGDIRRCLEKSHNPLQDTAQNIMSKTPKTVDASELAEKALFMMEQFSIQSLFVVNRDSHQPTHPVGLLHLQDLLKAKLR